MRSKVTVGNGAEADIVAMVDGQGRKFWWWWWIRPSELGIEPERSIRAAEEVAEAIETAAGGRGWLWVPS